MPKPEKKALIVAHTPYHLLNAINVSIIENKNADLIFVPDILNKKQFISAFVRAYGKNFKSLKAILGASEKYPKFLNRALSFINAVYIWCRALICRPCKIYLFHDMRPEGIFAAHAAKLIKADLIIIEDGTANYIQDSKDVGVLRRGLAKKLFSLKHNDPASIGDFIQANKILLIFPHCREMVYKTSEGRVAQLSSERLMSESFLKDTALFLGEDLFKKIARAKIAVVLPFGESKVQWLAALKSSNFSSADYVIKMHPRDVSVEGLEGLESQLLPPHIPFELVIIAGRSLTTLIGHGSTTMMTAKWLRPSIDSINLGPIANQRLRHTFECCGVKLISDLSELQIRN